MARCLMAWVVVDSGWGVLQAALAVGGRQRSGGSVRLHGVKPLVEGWVDALGWAGEAMAGHGVWFVALVVSVLVAVAGVLAEWQRRVTLLALVEKAPLGTVVVQESGRGGLTMHLRVGGPHAVGSEGETCEATADPEADSRSGRGVVRP